MHVDEAVLARVRKRFGDPAVLDWDGEISNRELEMVKWSPARRHDVTLFVTNGDRLALIRKPHFPDGIWRTPGGGIKPGEDFVVGVVRDAQLLARLAEAKAVFRFGDEAVPWRTHVLGATTTDARLGPLDTDEIAEARWGSAAELAGPIRERLLATGRALWRYRVALHDAALAELAKP